MTSPYLERPLRSLEEARRARHREHEVSAPSDSARVDHMSAGSGEIRVASIDGASEGQAPRGGLTGGNLGIAILIVTLLVGGVAAWSLSTREAVDQEALARELNALTPAAGPTAPKPTRIIGESEPEAPQASTEEMGPAPVFRP